MNKRDFQNRDKVKYTFDHMGRKVEVGRKFEKEIRDLGSLRVESEPSIDKAHFRLRRLEALRNRWYTVGKDMRNNIYALGMTVACFFIVFGSVSFYENKHLRIEALATLDKDMINRDLYMEFLEREGRGDSFDYDCFRDFNTI